MKYLQPKSPLNTAFYCLDYSKQFEGDAISSVTIDVTQGTVTLSKQAFVGTSVGVMIAGGVADEESLLTLTINTVGGQQLVDSASIYIIANENDADFSIVTKQQIVEFAFQDLRLSGYTFDHSPDEIAAMLARLDALMREYRLRGINTGYNMPNAIGASNLNDIAGIEDGLALSIATLLACSYMDGIGKTYSPNLTKKQQSSFNFVYAYCAKIPNRVLPMFTPRGAGGKQWSTLFPFMFNQPLNDRNAMLQGLSGQYIGIGVWDQSLWG